jgi:hypothetical protein
MNILSPSVNGQEAVTKSGTIIRPTDRIRALLPNRPKQAHSLADPTAGTYVVVTHPDWMEALQPLLRWKRQQGYRVELLCTTANQRDSIRARLTERYATASSLMPAQRYVLLVGDVDRIQAFSERYTPSGLTARVTDLYYGEYTGDYVPEAYVGRLSVADSAELAAVVAKIVAYEQGRWADSTSQLMFTAGRESRNPAPTTTNGQVNYLSGRVSECLPIIDTACFRNPTSAEQIDSLLLQLSHGNALVNYTAHCTASGWESPYITFNSIDTLNNSVPTVFVNNCCLSNAYNGTCFGERLLRRPTGGAVGVIGAANETLWNEDYYWAVGAKCPPTLLPDYDSTLPGAFDRLLCPSRVEDYTMGAMMFAGCQAVSMAGSPYDAFYWETYCLLGDPAMVPLLGRGDSLEWVLPDSLTAGSTLLQIIGTPFTRISATQDTQLLGTALIGNDSTCSLTLNRALAGDSLTLTATRPGAIPLVAVLPIISPRKARLAITQYRLDNSLLHVVIKNVGHETARQHHIHLTQDSIDRMAGATFGILPPMPLYSLLPQMDTTVSFDLGSMSIGNEPLLSATLTVTDSLLQAYSMLRIATPTPDLRPKIVGVAVLDSTGETVGELLPLRNYQLAVSISRSADSVSCRGIGVSSEEAESSEGEYRIPFTVEEDADHLFIALAAYKDRWQHHYECWLLPYSTWERFETGDFANLPWHQHRLYPWLIDSSDAHGGHFCARSGKVDHAQKSTMELEVETLADDSISFWFRVSSEAHDWLYFYIDDRKVGYWSGNSGWRRYARLLQAGKHRLQWIYQKDASRSEREDCAYIDDLRLPLAIWQQRYGTSEQNSTIASIVPFDEKVIYAVYPNPTSESVTIVLENSAQPRLIELFDMCGRKVDEILIPPNCNLTQYFTTLLRFGVYSMVLHDSKGNHVQKLIVTK